MTPIHSTIERMKSEFDKKFPELCRKVKGNPQDYYNADVPKLKPFLDTFAIELLEAVREEVKKKKPILWNDDHHRYLENVAKHNTIDEISTLLTSERMRE